MILMIDNYDSFTYNLVQMIQTSGYRVKTVRNDEISVAEIERLNPSHIIISPGPGRPTDAGISLRVIKRLGKRIPILGVCLGHQCIIEAFGGDIISAARIVHGKTSQVAHDNRGVFRNVSQGFSVVRYHSLAGAPETLPDCLEVSATSQDDATIMGVRHKKFQVCGVQFHPESIGTEQGCAILKNFFHYKREEPKKIMILKKIASGENLTSRESTEIMDEITDGELTESQLGAFLGALTVKGVRAIELSAFVNVLRQKTGITARISGVMDTCGTGGDGKHTFNISSAAALVCGACGIRIAKHGNRAVSSKSGSFDFLNALGVPTQGDLKVNLAAIRKNNFAFFFAPLFHSAMKHVAKVRQEIKLRTVFNMIGPLANPLPLDYQLVGIFDAAYLDLFAESMKRLGRKRAMVVHSLDGLDEISISDKTYVRELKKDGSIVAYEINPKDYDIKKGKVSDIAGGSAKENAALFFKIIGRKKLIGKALALRDAIALNAGAGLYISGKTKTIAEGYTDACRMLASKDFGQYLKTLQSAKV